MKTAIKLFTALLLLLLALSYLCVVLPLTVVGVLWLCGYTVSFWSAFAVMCTLYLVNLMMNMLLMSDKQ